MTIATYDQPSNGITPAADQSSRGVARIVQWAESAEAAHKLAVVLCKTSFCPEQFRDKPGETTAAILAGGEVGLSPMASMQAFDIISGRAAPRAITLRAVAQSLGHEIELVESSSARCRMRGRRKGSEGWQEVTWTIDRARQLGLTNKGNWKSQPTAMLLARATSEICRLVAADAILGIGYAAEELEDALDEKPASGPRKVQRQAIAAKPTPEPQEPAQDEDDLLGDGEPASPTPEPQKPTGPQSGPLDYNPAWHDDSNLRGAKRPQPGPASPPVTPAQLKMLGVQWSRVGVTDDTERHTFTSQMIGRDIGDTTKNLSNPEASGLIEKLLEIGDREALEQVLRGDDQPSLNDSEPPF